MSKSAFFSKSVLGTPAERLGPSGGLPTPTTSWQSQAQHTTLRFPSTRRFLWDRTPLAAAEVVEPKGALPVLSIPSDLPLRPRNDVPLVAVVSCKSGRQLRVALQCGARSHSADVNVLFVPLVWGSAAAAGMAGAGAQHQQLPQQDMASGLMSALQHSLDRRGPADLATGLALAASCANGVGAGPGSVALALTLLLPAAALTLTPLYGKRLCDVPLAQTLSQCRPQPDAQAAAGRAQQPTPGEGVQCGYLTMDQARSLVPLAADDANVYSVPLVGVWVKGASGPSHPALYAAALKFAFGSSLPDRATQPDGSFLLLLFTGDSPVPRCYEARFSDPQPSQPAQPGAGAADCSNGGLRLLPYVAHAELPGAGAGSGSGPGGSLEVTPVLDTRAAAAGGRPLVLPPPPPSCPGGTGYGVGAGALGQVPQWQTRLAAPSHPGAAAVVGAAVSGAAQQGVQCAVGPIASAPVGSSASSAALRDAAQKNLYGRELHAEPGAAARQGLGLSVAVGAVSRCDTPSYGTQYEDAYRGLQLRSSGSKLMTSPGKAMKLLPGGLGPSSSSATASGAGLGAGMRHGGTSMLAMYGGLHEGDLPSRDSPPVPRSTAVPTPFRPAPVHAGKAEDNSSMGRRLSSGDNCCDLDLPRDPRLQRRPCATHSAVAEGEAAHEQPASAGRSCVQEESASAVTAAPDTRISGDWADAVSGAMHTPYAVSRQGFNRGGERAPAQSAAGSAPLPRTVQPGQSRAESGACAAKPGDHHGLDRFPPAAGVRNSTVGHDAPAATASGFGGYSAPVVSQSLDEWLQASTAATTATAAACAPPARPVADSQAHRPNQPGWPLAPRQFRQASPASPSAHRDLQCAGQGQESADWHRPQQATVKCHGPGHQSDQCLELGSKQRVESDTGTGAGSFGRDGGGSDGPGSRDSAGTCDAEAADLPWEPALLRRMVVQLRRQVAQLQEQLARSLNGQDTAGTAPAPIPILVHGRSSSTDQQAKCGSACQQQPEPLLTHTHSTQDDGVADARVGVRGGADAVGAATTTTHALPTRTHGGEPLSPSSSCLEAEDAATTEMAARAAQAGLWVAETAAVAVSASAEAVDATADDRLERMSVSAASERGSMWSMASLHSSLMSFTSHPRQPAAATGAAASGSAQAHAQPQLPASTVAAAASVAAENFRGGNTAALGLQGLRNWSGARHGSALLRPALHQGSYGAAKDGDRLLSGAASRATHARRGMHRRGGGSSSSEDGDSEETPLASDSGDEAPLWHPMTRSNTVSTSASSALAAQPRLSMAAVPPCGPSQARVKGASETGAGAHSNNGGHSGMSEAAPATAGMHSVPQVVRLATATEGHRSQAEDAEVQGSTGGMEMRGVGAEASSRSFSSTAPVLALVRTQYIPLEGDGESSDSESEALLMQKYGIRGL